MLDDIVFNNQYEQLNMYYITVYLEKLGIQWAEGEEGDATIKRLKVHMRD